MSDIPVLVVDVGSASLKAGYAGDDSPVTVIPSMAQKCAKGVEVRVYCCAFRRHIDVCNVPFVRSWKILVLPTLTLTLIRESLCTRCSAAW